MKSLNSNNPILFFPSISLEDIEFKMQRKMNILCKLNLNRIKKKIKKMNVILSHNQIIIS